MSIHFTKNDDNLFLHYEPEFDSDGILSRLELGEEIHPKRCFNLNKELLIQVKEGFIPSFIFRVGDAKGQYFKLDSEVFGTSHDFYFSKEIKFDYKLFVASQQISILRRIDVLVQEDVYISLSEDSPNHIPYSAYLALIHAFPNSTELRKYANARIARILRNYLDGLGNIEISYEQYLNSRDSFTLNPAENLITDKKSLFQKAYDLLNYMLNNYESYSEKSWQEAICDVLCVIYPKYILAKREQEIGNDGRHKKRPDFLLVDSSGFIDVLEIKKPNNQSLITKTVYRNNYIADRDLSGSIVQLEKYIYCLNHGGSELEMRLQKNLKADLPPELRIRITNPQGILLMGRSNSLDEDQLFDLEIIKRQHKNIADIMTYDDLLERIKHITELA